MAFSATGKSREETPMGGPRDGASAELEILTISFIEHAPFYRMPSVAYFTRLAQFSKKHGVVCDGELKRWNKKAAGIPSDTGGQVSGAPLGGASHRLAT